MNEQKRKNNIIFFSVKEEQSKESAIETVTKLLEKGIYTHQFKEGKERLSTWREKSTPNSCYLYNQLEN